MIVLRYHRYGQVAYATVERPEALFVRYPERKRVKRTRSSPIGRITEIEGTGDAIKDRVLVSVVDGGRDEGGHRIAGGQASVRYMRLLDHKQHVRALASADEELLADHDREIAELEEKLRRVRAERAEALGKAWRRARPLGLDAIEERAKAELAEGRMTV